MRNTFVVAGAILVLASAAAAPPAGAAVIDFSTEISQLDGKPFVNPADDLSPQEQSVVATLQGRGYVISRPKKTTLGDLAIQVLLTPMKDEDPKEKLRKFTLAQHIQDATANKLQEHSKLDLSLEDTAYLKDLVGKNYPTLIMGQVWRILDPGSVPK